MGKLNAKIKDGKKLKEQYLDMQPGGIEWLGQSSLGESKNRC